jgi:HD-GYP domain-containing protein (c-di-GMP phosphodiesterase class II)
MQTRIMTIADIFDALTASDRPYKPALPPERALDILRTPPPPAAPRPRAAPA